ncbi:hypothetical protein Bca4012_044895 [Brassica carinata]|uniref:NAC domain-containing protein n=2 Tax=Brassica TaxID=3705 RepID=A0A0D3EBI8_BRAOL|nr:hypothetical protein Bca52824_057648 [Brassica carinata]
MADDYQGRTQGSRRRADTLTLSEADDRKRSILATTLRRRRRRVQQESKHSIQHFFVIVKPRTDTCCKTDGCEYGSWMIMVRDKLIKNEETGKLLGFKKILKFCVKKTTRGREYKRSWVMEEYRLPSKWNPKQDPVI